jgi:hypothetical protein
MRLAQSRWLRVIRVNVNHTSWFVCRERLLKLFIRLDICPRNNLWIHIGEKLLHDEVLHNARRVTDDRTGWREEHTEKCLTELVIREHTGQVMFINNVAQTKILEHPHEHALHWVSCLGCRLFIPHLVALNIANFLKVLQNLGPDLFSFFRCQHA